MMNNKREIVKSTYKLYKPAIHSDKRGKFSELYNPAILDSIRQISSSISQKNVFRGFHFQYKPGMDKVMHVRNGAATVYLVNLNKLYPDYLKVQRIFLCAWDRWYLSFRWWNAVGFRAHEDNTEMMYFHTATMNMYTAVSLHWSGFEDGKKHLSFYEPTMILSDKDAAAPTFDEWKTTEQYDQFLERLK